MNQLERFPNAAFRPRVQALPGGESPAVHEVTEPDRDIRIGLIIGALFFVLFLGWAAIAPLDAVAMAPGKLVVAGERQSVQHREGGVIAQILVKEGQKVAKGQVLIRLAGADVRAQERAIAGQAISLLAQRARLQAEQAGRSTIAPPAQFAGPFMAAIAQRSPSTSKVTGRPSASPRSFSAVKVSRLGSR